MASGDEMSSLNDCQERYILNDLLTYIQFYFNRSSHENIKKVVCRFYTPEDIADAKSVLWNINEVKSLMGKGQSRQRSVARDVYEADAQDILNTFIYF